MNKEDQVMLGIREIYNKMVYLNKVKMEEALAGFKSSEIHCIEYIGKNEGANVTKLSEAFYMTRGALSKVAKKLIEKGVIQSYQKEDNKKEIYYELTSEGRRLFDIHETLHESFKKRDEKVFEGVSEAQYNQVLAFIDRYKSHLDDEIQKEMTKLQKND